MTDRGSERARVLDWQGIRARLGQAEAATASALDPTPERARQMLEQRARDLAREPAATSAAAIQLNLIAFGLAGETYGIETSLVRQVVRLERFTPVPGTPDFVVGVTNVRGSVTPVFDIRTFFNLKASGLTDLSRLLLLGREEVEFGILADAVYGQEELAESDIAETSGAAAGPDRRFVRGIARSSLIVLDGAALLDDPRLAAAD